MDTKFCKDCKHYTKSGFCHHPINADLSLVTGEKRSIHSPEFMRDRGACGRQAKLWKPKS